MYRSGRSIPQERSPASLRKRVLPVLLLGCLLATPGPARSAPVQTAELLEEAQRLIAAAARAAYPDGRIAVEMLPLDPRLELAACDDLEYRLPGSRISSRQSIHVRCHGPQAWGFYATAQVRIDAPVLTLAHSVPRDAVLRADDLEVRYSDVTGLRDGYLSDAADAVGLTARHNLRAGATLHLHQLTRPKLVTRGDTVTLSASRGQVIIRTRAVALRDGSYGERIDVRNPRSERTVTAWVTGHGRVSTTPAASSVPEAGAAGKLN